MVEIYVDLNPKYPAKGQHRWALFFKEDGISKRFWKCSYESYDLAAIAAAEENKASAAIQALRKEQVR